jgi:dTDP-4-dehydrorhamnose reductase
VRILVTGAGGMLGRDVVTVLSGAGHVAVGVGRGDLDITDARACEAALVGFGWVVNCAAYTAVDLAQSDEAAAFRVNSEGAANLARAAHRAGARMLQVSTDYVFAGDGVTPYAEDAPLAPRTAYGRTKAAGEWATRAECPDALIVRTAWLYGPGGANIVKTMARLSREREQLAFVDDQRGQPTTTAHLARYLADLIGVGAPAGVYHGTCEGEATWCGLARAVFEELGLDPGRVRGITTAEYPLPAPRPAYSVLGHDRSDAVGVARLPHWRDALKETISDVVVRSG